MNPHPIRAKFPFVFKKLKLVSDSILPNSSDQTPTSSHSETFVDLDLNLDLMVQKQDFEPEEIKDSKRFKTTFKNSLILNGYSKTQELKLVKIGLASSKRIQTWAEKVLPNKKIFGEVLNANTLHYKTFKPHKGGLFCERIFGPLKDFECACGIKQKPFDNHGYVENLLDFKKRKRLFCPNCDVEYTWSIIRRYQLGYIRFASPVVHLWYLKTNPSYLALILDLRKKDLESIIYCMHTITLEYYWKSMHSLQLNLTPTNLFLSYQNLMKSQSNKKSLPLNTIQRRPFKYRKELKKRQRIKIQSSSLPFFTSINQSRPPLDNAPLEAKIQYLEKSFQLSTEDVTPTNLAKLSRLQHFFATKLSNREAKNMILNYANRSFIEFYKKFYFAFVSLKEQDRFTRTNHLKPFYPSFDKNRLKTFFSDLDGVRNQTKQTHKISQIILFFSLKNELKKNQKNKNYVFQRSEKTKEDDPRIEARPTTTFLPFYSKERVPNKTNFVSIQQKSSKTRESSKKFILLSNLNLLYFKSFFRSQKETIRDYFGPTQTKNSGSIEKTIKKTKPFQNWQNTWVLFFITELKKQDITNFDEKPSTVTHSRFLKRLIKSHYETYLFCQIKGSKDFKDWTFSTNRKQHSMNFNEELSFRTTGSDCRFNSFSSFFGGDDAMRFKWLKSTFQVFSFIDFQLYLKKNKTHIFFQKTKKKFKTNLFKRIDAKSICCPVKSTTKDLKRIFSKLNRTKKIQQILKTQEQYPTNLLEYRQNFRNHFQRLRYFTENEKTSTQSIFNNIYTSSCSEQWSTEKDWKYFLYYNTGPIEISDRILPTYKARMNRERVSSFSQSPVAVLGAQLIQKLLHEYEGVELKQMTKHYQNILPKLNRYIRYKKQVSERKTDFLQIQKLLQKRDQIIRRLKLLRKLFKKNAKTTSIVLNNLPVLPPDLRPILKMQNQIAASDLNRFYQRILYRNDRLRKFLRANVSFNTSEPGFEVKYAQRLLQESVDNLIQNGKGNVKPETTSRGQPLKSLSEILKGKQGRFRQYLLGKRVDYSGRSVIVVGPKLKIYECGLPFEMALELFLPFLIKKIFQYNFARTVIGAKTILKTETKLTWELLEQVMKSHPVLLNRAPTLHRLGIQAFQPKLIEGRAILLHPLVCPAFNADFDGDQMAVHVPITVEARTEAWKLMFARNHLISPATGESMLLPSQDMVLGCYYLTTETLQHKRIHFGRPHYLPSSFYFSTLSQVLQAYLLEKLHAQTPIWLKWSGLFQTDQAFSDPLEIQVETNGIYTEFRSKLQKRIRKSGSCETVFIRTTAGRVLFNLLLLGNQKERSS
jgi:DNA-directed RNA polymerase beta' subunit